MEKIKFDGPKKLALVAAILGFIAIFAADPYNTTTTEVNTKELAIKTLTQDNKIEPLTIADELINGFGNYRLVDLRAEAEYQKYFIPGAVNIPVTDILESGLLRNEKILLYSDDESIASQGWFLLKSAGYKGVYILDGGLDAWKEVILFPSLSSDAGKEEAAEFEKIAEISRFFGGTPQTTEGTEISKDLKMPELKTPVQTNLTLPKKKKKREGC